MFTRSDRANLRSADLTAWSGWIVFAGTMMVISGALSMSWGVAALIRDQVFVVGLPGNVVGLDYTTWGLIHIFLGAVVAAVGLLLLAGSTAAGVFTVLLAMVSIIGNLLIIRAYPVWSLIVIAVDVLVIYAITVHAESYTRHDSHS